MSRQRGPAASHQHQQDLPARRHLDRLLDEAAPLDEQAQAAVLCELTQQAAAAARLAGRAFGGGGLALASFFAWAAWAQWSAPWQVRYTGELRGAGASAGGAALALALQAAGLAAAGGAMLLVQAGAAGSGAVPEGGLRIRGGGGGGGASRPPVGGEGERDCWPAAAAATTTTQPARRAWAAAGAGAVAAAVGGSYWAAALVGNVRRWGWEEGAHVELTWLPLGPLAFCLVCCYVLHSLAVTGRELQKLHRLRYDLKAV